MSQGYRLYVIELSEVAKGRFRTDATCLYVGQSWHPAEVRFQQHKDGVRASRHVKRYGLKLRPDLYEHLPAFPDVNTARRQERRLGNQLRNRGFFIVGPNYSHGSKAHQAAAKKTSRRSRPTA